MQTSPSHYNCDYCGADNTSASHPEVEEDLKGWWCFIDDWESWDLCPRCEKLLPKCLKDAWSFYEEFNE